MEYNSQRDKLIVPEYGRHIQRMIDHVKTINNRDLRQAHAEAVIKLMETINPLNKSTAEATERLWNHLFRIANFELDVTPPDGINPSPDSVIKRPEKPAYNSTRIRYRHYGNYVQKLVDKAAEESDPAKQRDFLVIIGSYMKLAYKTWNPKHYASDENIRTDLKNLCKGKLEVPDDIYIDALSSSKTIRKENPKNPAVPQRKKKRRKRR
ncbi:MAG: DUF4290 domain-containing protein [Saprospirales bacterium]|nr:MAG: DUF4290 domain-containing protein [Saprospirales bacterium]